MINTPVMLKWKEWQRVISGICHWKKSGLVVASLPGPRTARRDIWGKWHSPKRVLPSGESMWKWKYRGNCFLPAQLVLQEYFCKHDSNPKGLKHNLVFSGHQESCASNSNESSQTFCQNIRLIQFARTQARDKSYRCPDNNSLTHSTSLGISKWVRSREKPYEWRNVENSSAGALIWLRHRLIHTGENLMNVRNVEKIFSAEVLTS